LKFNNIPLYSPVISENIKVDILNMINQRITAIENEIKETNKKVEVDYEN